MRWLQRPACAQAGDGQPESWDRLGLWVYFQLKLNMPNSLLPPLHAAISESPLFLICGGQIFRVFISCGKKASSVRIILLVLLSCGWPFYLKKKKPPSLLKHHVHWCTHTPPPPRLHPEIDLTTGVPSRNRKTRPCEVTRKIGQGLRSGAVVSFTAGAPTGVLLFPHWKFYLRFVFLVHIHLWLYQCGGFLPV